MFTRFTYLLAYKVETNNMGMSCTDQDVHKVFLILVEPLIALMTWPNKNQPEEITPGDNKRKITNSST